MVINDWINNLCHLWLQVVLNKLSLYFNINGTITQIGEIATKLAFKFFIVHIKIAT